MPLFRGDTDAALVVLLLEGCNQNYYNVVPSGTGRLRAIDFAGLFPAGRAGFLTGVPVTRLVLLENGDGLGMCYFCVYI